MVPSLVNWNPRFMISHTVAQADDHSATQWDYYPHTLGEFQLAQAIKYPPHAFPAHFRDSEYFQSLQGMSPSGTRYLHIIR